MKQPKQNPYISKRSIRNTIIKIIDNQDFSKKKIRKLTQVITAAEDANLSTLLAYLYDRWANYLTNIAARKTGAEQAEYFRKAFKKYKKATKLNPSSDKYFYNWGHALGELAKLKGSAEAVKLELKGIKKYKQAAKLYSNFDSTYYNWASALLNIALAQETDAKRKKYLKKAIPKLKKTISINPWHENAWSKLGTIYSFLAECESGKKADAWNNKAIACYASVLRWSPRNVSVHDSWAIILKDMALTKEGAEAEALFILAIKKHLQAIEYGEDVYNLACTYAAMGDERNALIWLQKSVLKQELSPEEIWADPDWKPYLTHKTFLEIMEGI